MLRYLRDPIWQFFGVVATIVLGVAAIAIADPALVRRWWLPGLVGALALIALVALAVNRRLIIRAFRWLRRQIKRTYLRMLWHLVVRPARDHLEMMIHPYTGGVSAEELTQLGTRLSGLQSDALQVLEVALGGYDPFWEGNLLIRPATVALTPPPNSYSDRERRVMAACDHLKTRRVIDDYEVWQGKGGYKVRLRLHSTLRPALVRGAGELVVDELISRNIAPFLFRELPVRVGDRWRYDFYENFANGHQQRHPGSDIELHPEAVCNGERKKAIFEHPPDDDKRSTIITYTIAPPSRASLLVLTGLVGIETFRPTPDGLQPSGRIPGNDVKFQIVIDGQVKLKQRKKASDWERFSIMFVAGGGDLSVRFVTNNLGENVFNWAVWGEPELIEVLRLWERTSPTDG